MLLYSAVLPPPAGDLQKGSPCLPRSSPLAGPFALPALHFAYVPLLLPSTKWLGPLSVDVTLQGSVTPGFATFMSIFRAIAFPKSEGTPLPSPFFLPHESATLLNRNTNDLGRLGVVFHYQFSSAIIEAATEGGLMGEARCYVWSCFGGRGTTHGIEDDSGGGRNNAEGNSNTPLPSWS